MFRMALMATVLEERHPEYAGAVEISLCHDMAECLVGDITPQDKVSDEEKHRREVEAMRSLTKDLPDWMAEHFFGAFMRYDDVPRVPDRFPCPQSRAIDFPSTNQFLPSSKYPPPHPFWRPKRPSFCV